ncbi:MAG TPA: pseudouridine synthase [Nevskiaceae bacterium]
MIRSNDSHAVGAAPDAGERIHKRLAEAGVASRRTVESWIRDGRITVNGAPAVLGQRVARGDRIALDGKSLHVPAGHEATRVLRYKKRVGEVVTRADPEGRRTVFRKLPKLQSGRWIAVGRLDINTSGLLLMTNDGELARRLMHPSYDIERQYAVRVLGEIDDALLERLRRGVALEDGRARCERIERQSDDADADAANHWLSLSVHEGRNRLVRRLFESQGLQVSRLMRISYGPIPLGHGIRSGTAQELEPAEVAALCAAVGLQPRKAEGPAPQGRLRGSGPGSRRPGRPRPASGRRR